MDIKKSLQIFGLSKNEATVYLALLKQGSTTVGPLVTRTKIHRQAVYEALARLENMKLVSHVTKNNRKNYQASSPSVIVDQAKQQQLLASGLVGELLKVQKRGDDGVDVKIGHGQQEYFNNLLDFIRSAAKHDHIIRIIGGASDTFFYDTLGSVLYNKYLAELKKTRVKKYLIAAADYSSSFKQKFAKERGNILKTMATGLVSPTFTRITPEMMSVEVFTQEVMIVQIRNKPIAQAYLDHFEILWKQAKKYTSK